MIWYYNSQPIQKNQECAVPLYMQGESDVTQYTADVSDWLALWPDGTVVVVLRPADGSAPYMADTSLNRETGIITWNITAYDTAIVGYGVGELRLVADNYVKKSYPFKTYVKASILAAAGDPPAPVPDWVNEAIQQMQKSANAAEAAQQGAEAAQAAAEAAQAATEQAAEAQIEAISAAGNEQISSVQAAGTEQISGVQAEGAAQVAAVQQKGEETLASIPDNYTELSDDVADLKSAAAASDKNALLHAEEIDNTVQTIAFDASGNVQSITHTRDNVAIRTDVFTFGASTITEARTLNTGETLTIVTNTNTLQTTVTYTAA